MEKITIIFMLGFFTMNGQGATCGDILVHLKPTSTNPAGAQYAMSNALSQSGAMIGDASNVSKLYNTKSSAASSKNVLLYDTWDNSGTIYTYKGNYTFKKVNFDLQRGIVLIKAEDSQIYTFVTRDVKKMVINNDTYQVLANRKSGDHQLFQVLHQEEDGFKVLKGYQLLLKKASPHAMLNMGVESKIRKKESYYVSDSKSFASVRMGKNKILKILSSKDYKALRALLNKNNNRRVVSNK